MREPYSDTITVSYAEPVFGMQVGKVSLRVHNVEDCRGRHCVIHKPSDHPLKDAPLNWRGDKALMERICEHGIGHIDWDDYQFKVLSLGKEAADAEAVHGCCGCCAYDVEIEGLPACWIQAGYAARSDGSIWSFWKSRGPSYGNSLELTASPKRLRPRANQKGYYRVNLGRSQEGYVHRLVWTAWRGVIREGMQVRHRNGVPANNAIYNLALGTQADNEADKDRHGTRPMGAGHANSKLSAEQVLAARALSAEGKSLAQIKDALDLPVHKATLHDAIRGKTWAHLSAA